ncbi:hypothetical protein F5Y03DRAFT_1475 [Xylaria venustula]|nr:hypothetical protein F5Y03DRAFT_1475 [Xylaria venustula]
MSSTKKAPERLYFAYGSNLSTTQMLQRCPQSTAIGLARLTGWTWIINERGYANIVPKKPLWELEKDTKSISNAYHDHSPDPGAVVYGLVYRLHPNDEDALDRYEGVGSAYEKWTMTIPRTQFWKPLAAENVTSSASASSRRATPMPLIPETKKRLDSSEVVPESNDKIQMLVYIDTDRIEPSKPKDEYIDRMNLGIEEAMEWRLPAGYVNRVLRPSIPPPPKRKRTLSDSVSW